MPEIISKEKSKIMIDGNANYLKFIIEFNEDGSPIDCHQVT